MEEVFKKNYLNTLEDCVNSFQEKIPKNFKFQNFEFSKGTDISGIKEFSFHIPEIITQISQKYIDSFTFL